MAIDRIQLSASVDGKAIVCGATFTTIHVATANTGASQWDEVFLWFTNTYSSPLGVLVGWGGQTDPNERIVYNYVLAVGSAPALLVPGFIIHNGLTIYAAGVGAANRLLCNGYVNRYS